MKKYIVMALFFFVGMKAADKNLENLSQALRQLTSSGTGAASKEDEGRSLESALSSAQGSFDQSMKIILDKTNILQEGISVDESTAITDAVDSLKKWTQEQLDKKRDLFASISSSNKTKINAAVTAAEKLLALLFNTVKVLYGTQFRSGARVDWAVVTKQLQFVPKGAAAAEKGIASLKINTLTDLADTRELKKVWTQILTSTADLYKKIEKDFIAIAPKGSTLEMPGEATYEQVKKALQEASTKIANMGSSYFSKGEDKILKTVLESVRVPLSEYVSVFIKDKTGKLGYTQLPALKESLNQIMETMDTVLAVQQKMMSMIEYTYNSSDQKQAVKDFLSALVGEVLRLKGEQAKLDGLASKLKIKTGVFDKDYEDTAKRKEVLQLVVDLLKIIIAKNIEQLNKFEVMFKRTA